MATERLTLMEAFKVINKKHIKTKVYLVPHPFGFCCLSIALNVYQECHVTYCLCCISLCMKIMTKPLSYVEGDKTTQFDSEMRAHGCTSYMRVACQVTDLN